MQVIPAILPHSFGEILEKTSRIEDSTTFLQIDLCDGVFGREITWLPEDGDIMPSGFTFEFDVMLIDWKTYIPRCVALGAKKIVAHIDNFSDGDMEDLILMLEGSGISLGISISNDKTVETHAAMIRLAQGMYQDVYIQVMGIRKIGEQGQFFDEEVLDRIIELEKTFGGTFIQVDGGITEITAKLVINKGADAVVVGSYIFGHENASTAYQQLACLEREGEIR